MKYQWKSLELCVLLLYAMIFYMLLIQTSWRLSSENAWQLPGLRKGWISDRPNDLSDAQWRNFRGNIVILTIVFGVFTFLANVLRSIFHLRRKGMSIIWLTFSLGYLLYLHGACIIFILSIVSLNYALVKVFAGRQYFLVMMWIFHIAILLCNRIYHGYSFSEIWKRWAFLDSYRGTFRWHICFNFVTLRMISFSYDYHMDRKESNVARAEKFVGVEFSIITYLCYLLFAPLYIAGPIISFCEFAHQLDAPESKCSSVEVVFYGVRWFFSLLLMETVTHFFYYNAFAISGLWIKLSAWEIFIIGYGVLLFMWLKFLLIWRFFRFWSLSAGIQAPENMPRCINNCHSLEMFWKNWHASFNKWLVRYMYIPLGGSRKKVANVWVIFTFVAIWHDIEWKLVSWAWLTCLFFVPEMIVKSMMAKYKVTNGQHHVIFRELNALAGAVTIYCLMAANLVGYVIGLADLRWLCSKLFCKEGFPTLIGMLITFYVGTKIMFHIDDSKCKNGNHNS